MSRRIILSLLTAPLPSAIARGEDAAVGLPELLAALGQVTRRQARFRETRELAVLDRPLESEGVLSWERPDRLEKRTEWPSPERLTVIGDRVTVASVGQPDRSLDLSAQPPLRALIDGLRAPLAGDAAALHAVFEVALRGPASGWTLRLRPRERRARALVDQLEIDGVAADPTEIRVQEANGDRQVLRLEPMR